MKGHNRYQLYYMVQYMLYAIWICILSKTRATFQNQKQNINHHQPSIFTNKKNHTRPISIHFPRFPCSSNGKKPGTRCVFLIFSGFWLVGFAALPLRSALPIPSRLIRARSLPRWFQWPRVAQTNLRHLTTASEVSTVPLRSWKVRVWLVVGWWLTKTGWFFGGRGRKMRKIWEREGLFCLFFGGDEE